MYDYRGRTAVRHSGSIDGMVSLITMLPEEDVGVVVLTNMVPTNFPTALTNHLVDLLLDVPGRDWNADFLDLRRKYRKKLKQEEWYWEKARDVNAKRSLPLQKYLGEYLDSLSGTATVSKEHGELVFRYNDKYVGDLNHWQHDVYRVSWRDPYVRIWAGQFLVFVPDGKGGIGSLRVVFDNEIEFTQQHEPE